VQACGFTGAPAPWELQRALMCRLFGCLPSELDAQEADVILEAWSVLNLYEEFRAKRPE
jgi:hypothetical protein